MLEYNEFEVEVIEDIKELLVNDERFKSRVSREDVYLFRIPEEHRSKGLVVRLNYINVYSTVFYGDKSNGDGYIIQVDIWDKRKPPLGISNLVRAVLEEQGFSQLPASFEEPDEDGSYRDSRRYEGVLRK